MAVKVQFNPSTGKVSFNPVTGKVQVLDDATPAFCSRCSGGDGVTPYQLAVNISGLINYCIQTGSSVYRQLIGSAVSSNLNRDWVLTNSGVGSCTWIATESIGAGEIRYGFYNFATDCGESPVPEECDFVALTLSVTVRASTVFVQLSGRTSNACPQPGLGNRTFVIQGWEESYDAESIGCFVNQKVLTTELHSCSFADPIPEPPMACDGTITIDRIT